MKKTLGALVLAGAAILVVPQAAWAVHAARPAYGDRVQYSYPTRYQGAGYYSQVRSPSLSRKYRAGGF